MSKVTNYKMNMLCEKSLNLETSTQLCLPEKIYRYKDNINRRMAKK